MADLGLNTLNDDQLLDLLTEACAELGQRDPVVRNLAQKQIYAEAERVKAYKDAVGDAVKKARADYEASIRKESRDWVDNLVKTGKWKPVDNCEELAMVLEEDKRRREEIIANSRRSLESKDQVNLWLHIQTGCVKASYFSQGGQRQTESVGKIDAVKIEKVVRALKEALGV